MTDNYTDGFATQSDAIALALRELEQKGIGLHEIVWAMYAQVLGLDFFEQKHDITTALLEASEKIQEREEEQASLLPACPKYPVVRYW